MKTFKAGIVPGDIKEYAIEDGATVREALTLAGLPMEGYEIMVGGAKATLDTPVSNNAYIVLTKQIKGNFGGGSGVVRFKIGIVPGDIKEYALNAGATVNDALEIADLPKTGYEIMVGGAKATLETAVFDNAYIVLTKQIKGN